MLKILEEKTGAARGHDHIAGITREEPDRQQKRAVTEVLVAPLPPQDKWNQQGHGKKQSVDDLQELRERGSLDALQPDGGVGVPDGEIQVREAAVGALIPDRRDE